MNKLNLLVSSRDRNRRQRDRRNTPRRIIQYAFGSEKWIQVVRALYIFWPKEDRRAQERRTVTRRMAERRMALSKYRLYAFRKQGVLRRQQESLVLTEEEKKMLSELNQRF